MHQPTRREFIRTASAGAAAIGLGGTLAACGSSASTSAASSTLRPHRSPRLRSREARSSPGSPAIPRAIPSIRFFPSVRPITGAFPISTTRSSSRHPRAIRCCGSLTSSLPTGRDGVDGQTEIGHHLPRRQAAHRGRRHLHASTNPQVEVGTGGAFVRSDRRQRFEKGRLAHGHNAMQDALCDSAASYGDLDGIHDRACRLQSEEASRHRAVQARELPARRSDHDGAQPQLLGIRASIP